MIQSTAVTAAPVRPRPLLWLYLLVLAGVLTVGAAAGGIVFTGYRPLAFARARALTSCSRQYHVNPLVNLGTRQVADPAVSDRLLGFGRCITSAERIRGFTMIGGAAAAVILALVLMLLVSLADRWRLPREFGQPIPGAHDRFTVLCQRHGVSGRRRPRLLIADRPVVEPRTIAMPGGRPLVVLPASVAILYTDPARFDPFVTHELGHVLAKDVTWVSAVRGLVWLPIPVVLLASVPEFAVAGDTTAPLTALTQCLLLAVITAVFSAGLLRLRERQADRYAAAAVGTMPFVVALAAERRASSGRDRWYRRVFASHPDPLARVAALAKPDHADDGGMVQGFAVGLLAAICMGGVSATVAALNTPSSGWLPGLAAAAVGAVVLGCGLTPSLHRRAEALSLGMGAGWWRPVAGVAGGLTAGVLVPLVNALPGTAAFPLPSSDLVTNLRDAVLVGAVGAAAVAVSVGLVTLAAGRSRRSVCAVATATAVLVTFTVLWPLSPVALPVRNCPELFTLPAVRVAPF